MIAIVNISDNPQPTGEHTYALKINHRALLQFQHRREDSLSTCLRKAADAYDKEQMLTHKRHGGLKLGHNLTTALRMPRMVVEEQPFTRQEIEDICNIRYGAE